MFFKFYFLNTCLLSLLNFYYSLVRETATTEFESKDCSNGEIPVTYAQPRKSKLYGIGCKKTARHTDVRHCCSQILRPRMPWCGSNESFVSLELVGTLTIPMGQVVFELWPIENH